jgi:hypothetical protein
VVRLTEVRAAHAGWQRDYEPEPLDVALTYFRSARSGESEELSGAAAYWAALALGGTALHPVGGTHGQILERPYVEAVAAVLRELV